MTINDFVSKYWICFWEKNWMSYIRNERMNQWMNQWKFKLFFIKYKECLYQQFGMQTFLIC